MTRTLYTSRSPFVPLLVANLWLLCLTACAQQSSSGITPVSPAQFAELTQQKVVVLDVRTPAEYDEGHLSDARPLNFYDAQLEARIADLDTSQTYLLYCTVGQRSQQMVELMARKGFKHLYHLRGGLRAWQQAGYPVTQ